MPRTIESQLSGEGCNIAIVATRFNGHIVESLIAGAVDTLVRHGVSAEAITLVRCPGAWELPLIVQRLAKAKAHDAIIALGCVIRGETPHFDYVAGECNKGMAKVMLDSGVPVLNGVLTTDTTDQALARAGLKAGNKGADAAMAALEMCGLLEQL
ncbi:MAG: 6,7-dimethyl-8-ribityllumazine synthase [Planctomycetota bacterium]